MHPIVPLIWRDNHPVAAQAYTVVFSIVYFRSDKTFLVITELEMENRDIYRNGRISSDLLDSWWPANCKYLGTANLRIKRSS